MILESLTATTDTASSSVSSSPAIDPQRQAAEQLQIAFFKDMLMHGGFADAFSTGSNTLDSFTSIVVESVAKDIAEKDSSLADHFYNQLQRDKS